MTRACDLTHVYGIVAKFVEFKEVIESIPFDIVDVRR